MGADWDIVVDRQAAYEFAAEMATWPEPIDVIRDALELPWRWQRHARRALRTVLRLFVDRQSNTATEAEAARMARLMLASGGFNMTEAELARSSGSVAYRRRKGR